MRAFLISAVSFAALAAPAQAADDSGPIDRGGDVTITVVATGTDVDIRKAGQAIAVVGADELAAVQGPDLTRALERLPGVTFARNGGLGTATSVFVRGASSEQLLVLVDGARVMDVASPGGAYDFSNLSMSGVGKIELLRGSNSVIWGSDAIGGVLAVTSREVNGLEASAEYGARDSFNGQVDAGLSGDRYSVALNGGFTRSDGFSAAAVGTEPDGFRQWRLGGRGRVEFAPGLSASVTARYARNRVDLDGYPAPLYAFDDTPEYQKSREFSGRAGIDYRSEALDLGAGLALTDMRRANYDPTFGDDPNFSSNGRRERADLKGVWRPGGALRLDFGADHEWTRFSTSASARVSARIASAHGLLGWYGERLTLAAGLRYDDHSRFGGEWTVGANGAFEIGGGWRVRASYGEGFKAPTLYQLYSDYGNLALSPERSRSYDVSIEKGNRNAPLHLAVTGFRRDSRNLIDYVSCFSVVSGLCGEGRYGFYDNIARARSQGVEVELGARVSERFRAQAAYTYLETENRTPGGNFHNVLARRPKHAVTVSADWTLPILDATLGGDLRMVGDSFDDAANSTRNDGYVLATVRASLPLNDAFELYGRVENVTDARYRTVAGFGTAGRSAFIGARARF